MSSANYPLRQSGIYRNLPQFDPSIKNLKAIICGATGISGFNALRALRDTPDRWSKVYTLSRSPLKQEMLNLLTEKQRCKIQHVSVDLTSSGDSVAKSLKDAGVDADYVFFYSYLQPKTGESGMSANLAKALVEANVPLLDNFLQSLPKAGIKPKRILLQTTVLGH
ncbi:hypothetical protein CLAFUW4_06024 [Fulvia fulva]|uniref:Uncharacterized protein n=1 Tax=Passalora fulva TaxID=5499 RepID=A0A9Q8LI14_PASFU|nr:uncharacterized protein CLAFUR5_06168 [Fulvia fulva]KAK4624442.1 hypothetical protein CLAFUR4_06029 [Fulvia fulva]KAK4625544.1 hypothetical protein CLAFUR0_06032 [Fulvia fulva]UJO18006.1 hypothetical protein CLAFUR5_06168 [Fulvia fulva]WPV14538.1 hypothetical protein CLAFUW4_06024 [Fulvia fulva]WPV30009.1 hypothetical protein CLAFUW7_06022 [Fulvia fulva]